MSDTASSDKPEGRKAGVEHIRVHGETDVGWDERALPNETVDEQGNRFPEDRGFGVPDPRAPGRRAHDDPQVNELRAHLRAHNGIHGLEICSPDEVERIASIFRRDGFVVVRDLLDAEQLARFREASARVLQEILNIPGTDGRKYVTESYRLPHRYSYGTASASRHMLHDPAWADVIDLPTTTPILRRIFGSDDYLVVGAGGDLCLPGAIEYQHLHYDARESHRITPGRLEQARQLGIELRTRDGSDALQTRTEGIIIERTPPAVTVNFLMSDLTTENGPIRQIPGTHGSVQRPPTPEEEPEGMRLSTLVGALAGGGVIRDTRAWHGATPNVSREIRAMPNVEYGPAWRPSAEIIRSMPHEIWRTLSPHARHLCRRVKAEPGKWPKGAGRMHPLADLRRPGRRTNGAPN